MWSQRGSQWVSSGPRGSQMIVWTSLRHHKKTRVGLVQLYGSYSSFREAALLAGERASRNRVNNYPISRAFGISAVRAAAHSAISRWLGEICKTDALAMGWRPELNARNADHRGGGGRTPGKWDNCSRGFATFTISKLHLIFKAL